VRIVSDGADTGFGEWRGRTVPIETAEAARALATKSPWNYAWRPLRDGSLEVAHIADRRVVLHRFRPGVAEPELLAESARTSRLSAALMCSFVPAFVSLILIFAVSPWFILVMLGFVGLLVLGVRLDEQPGLRPWVRERFGSDEDWATMPRVVGDLPATGNQLIALCAFADSHKDAVLYRPLVHGTVEVALERPGGYEIQVMDREGDLRAARTVEIRRPSERKLRKAEGDGPKWKTLMTDDPPGD
jgi:hypothetical protein